LDFIEKKAKAKINIGLDILGKFANGYHEVKMIMHTVNLADTLSFQKNNTGKATMCSSDKTIPEDERNLIVKAANLFRNTYEVTEGVHIELEKRIPHAAGLGGGSADAATTLLALNELFQIHASQDELFKLGVKIGADVPFCIMGGTALAEGIGEKLTPIQPLPICTIVLVKPKISVSTAHVYQSFDLQEMKQHPDIDGIIKALEKQNLHEICVRLGNVLETVTIQEFPKLKTYKEYMKKQGALGSLMSGSGPTIFGIFENRMDAERVAHYFKQQPEIASVNIT
jgi:4-diphosphocytidyl-2-C-methyl-D-erythritol kinase